MTHIRITPLINLILIVVAWVGINACGKSNTGASSSTADAGVHLDVAEDGQSDSTDVRADTIPSDVGTEDATDATKGEGETFGSDTLSEVGSSSDNGATVDDAMPSTVDSQDSSPAQDVSVSDTTNDVSVSLDTGSGNTGTTENLWLLSIDNGTDFLQRIDVATGEATNLCKLPSTGTIGGIFTNISYPSLTFSRTNTLFASRSGNSLDAINPCTCEVVPIGSYGGPSGVNGITSDFGAGLFGVAVNQDETIAIDPNNGIAEIVGALGFNFGSTGATWSEAESLLYAIDATTDGLYKISPETGAATFVTTLTKDFGTVGIEMHPANGKIYACSSDAHLLEVDPITGVVTDIGDMDQMGSCTNLAAPWAKVDCIAPE